MPLLIRSSILALFFSLGLATCLPLMQHRTHLLVLTFSEEVKPEEWAQQFTTYELQYQLRTNCTMNSHLFTFNPRRIDPAVFRQQLLKQPEVVLLEFIWPK